MGLGGQKIPPTSLASDGESTLLSRSPVRHMGVPGPEV